MVASGKRSPTVGIFAGGAGKRMLGADKAALAAPGGERTILEHQVQLATELGLPCVLLGARAAWSTRFPDLPNLQDSPAGIGPLGALSALLSHVADGHVITLACDMPYVDGPLLERLRDYPSDAAVVAPQDERSGKWQPLFARYDVARVLPVLEAELAVGTRSFQQLLSALRVEALPLSEAEHRKLRDWDTPEDLELGA